MNIAPSQTASADTSSPVEPTPVDCAMAALCLIAGYYRIAAEARGLAKQLAIGVKGEAEDILRGAKQVGLKARLIAGVDSKRLNTLPLPAIACLKNTSFAIVAGMTAAGGFRLIDPATMAAEEIDTETLLANTAGDFILLQRRLLGPGQSATSFGLRWFLPSIWKYRSSLSYVLIASLFLQLFALITPLFFQVVVDKVLAHRSYSTLTVLAAGLVAVGLFEVVLQYLRTYILTHTTSRIDVELGRRLFRHLLGLPLSYFETRAAGQTVARVRELETIRDFLTGQGLFSGLDAVFAFVFIAVLFAYSTTLAWIVVASIPFYIAIGFIVRPFLRLRIDEQFDRGALSQQLLIESVIGMQTLKAGAIEPVVASQWEERLAAYVRASFEANMLAAKGQNAIQYVAKLTSAALLFFGAQAVIDGSLSVGALIAFNMIAAQVAQPVLRLSQLWQDFQQVQISVSRLADILDAPAEPRPSVPLSLPRPRGAISFKHVNFRYAPGGPEILKGVSLDIAPGEVIGIVGPSGSGKSTLTKLAQRFYMPESGQVFVDGQDISQADPAWLRAHIGVVLQENLLFNRTIHDNIALSNPALSREAVINLARLSGADEFIAKLPNGYETMIEERGANLSGGQRQRIAIARALSTNPPILILDEATSALDYDSERIVLNNMRHIVKGRTVIIIAHRLATVRACNRIVGIAEGRVVETGSHAELLERQNGLYRHLWQLQNGMADAGEHKP